MAGMSLAPSFMNRLGGGMNMGSMARNPMPSSTRMPSRPMGQMKAPTSRAPTAPPVSADSMPMPQSGISTMPSLNFGAGLFPSLPFQFGNYQQGMQNNMGNIGGLWNSYNRLRGIGPDEAGVPNKGLYY